MQVSPDLRIANGQIKVIPEKVAPILQLKVPTSKKQMQEFLGLINFYRDFCLGLAEIAEPLYALTRKEHDFVWTQVHQKAFDAIKHLLTEPPFLRLPNPRKPFIISSDASGKALGAVLSQLVGDCEYPVAYASRVLSGAEQNYSVIEKELLAITYALKKFRCFIYGTHFTVFRIIILSSMQQR